MDSDVADTVDMNELDMLPPAGVAPRDIDPGVFVPGPIAKSAWGEAPIADAPVVEAVPGRSEVEAVLCLDGVPFAPLLGVYMGVAGLVPGAALDVAEGGRAKAELP